jgi:hypothetical protein
MKQLVDQSVLLHQWRLWSIYPEAMVAITELYRISSDVTRLTFCMP